MAKNWSKILISAGINMAGCGLTTIGVAKANAKLNEFMPPMAVGIGEIVIGALLPVFKKSREAGILDAVGNGMIAAGSIAFANSLSPGFISGTGDTENSMSGDDPYLPTEVNGLPQEDNLGYTEENDPYEDVSGLNDNEENITY